MSARGLSAPGFENIPKISRKRVKTDSTILTLFSLHFDFLGTRGREVPGTHFGLFWSLWVHPGAQMTPAAGQSFRNFSQLLCRRIVFRWRKRLAD